MTTGYLRQTKKSCEYVGCGYFRIVKLCIAFIFYAAVKFSGILFKFNAAYFLCDSRQIQTFSFCYTECCGVELFKELLFHPLTEYRCMIAVAAHIEVSVAEGIE